MHGTILTEVNCYSLAWVRKMPLHYYLLLEILTTIFILLTTWLYNYYY